MCPESSRNIREVQCASYNNKPFMGRFYEWEPFAEGKGRELGPALLSIQCFGKANVIFALWKLSGFDCWSLPHFPLFICCIYLFIGRQVDNLTSIFLTFYRNENIQILL